MRSIVLYTLLFVICCSDYSTIDNEVGAIEINSVYGEWHDWFNCYTIVCDAFSTNNLIRQTRSYYNLKYEYFYDPERKLDSLVNANKIIEGRDLLIPDIPPGTYHLFLCPVLARPINRESFIVIDSTDTIWGEKYSEQNVTPYKPIFIPHILIKQGKTSHIDLNNQLHPLGGRDEFGNYPDEVILMNWKNQFKKTNN